MSFVCTVLITAILGRGSGSMKHKQDPKHWQHVRLQYLVCVYGSGPGMTQSTFMFEGSIGAAEDPRALWVSVRKDQVTLLFA